VVFEVEVGWGIAGRFSFKAASAAGAPTDRDQRFDLKELGRDLGVAQATADPLDPRFAPTGLSDGNQDGRLTWITMSVAVVD
jgi:hypothetical protein